MNGYRMMDGKLSGLSLLFQTIAASVVSFLCRTLPPQELSLREIPSVWIVSVVLFALFTAVESYFVLTRFLINMKRLFSLQEQKIYFSVLTNIAVLLLLNGGIMLCFANQKGVVTCAVGLIGLLAGLGLSFGMIRFLQQREQ